MAVWTVLRKLQTIEMVKKNDTKQGYEKMGKEMLNPLTIARSRSFDKALQPSPRREGSCLTPQR